MRILYVVHGLPPRVFTGTESYTYQLASRLAPEHEVGVFHLYKDALLPLYKREKNAQNGFTCFGVNFDVITQATRFRETYRNSHINAAFKNCLEQFRPDLVHFTYFLGGLSVDQIHMAKERGAKVVVTLTDFLPLCLRGQLLDYRGELCSGPESGYKCSACVWMVKRIRKGRAEDVRLKLLKFAPAANVAKRLIARAISGRQRDVAAAIRAADRVITPTKALARQYRRWVPCMKKSTLLGFGIDPALFRRFNRTRGEKIRFGFIGQMLPHKGLHVLVDAAKRLPPEKCAFVVFGGTHLPGSTEYVADFEDDLKRENIFWRGTFPFEKIADAFAQFDVLVVPSLWYENSPLVVLYAKRSQTPMIVSDFGGLTEFVREGVSGLVVPPGDAGALAGAMQRFIDDPDLCEHMSEGTTAPMSIDEHARTMLDIYRELL